VRSSKSIPRRGIYFLPSVFTVANIFFGFYSIIMSISGDLEVAAVAIGLAVVFDILDGRVARMANATSEFGREFDSLADLVSFGVAPGVLVFSWGLSLWPRVGWLACFLFVVCGAMRLARFNIQQKSVDKRFFVGMPIPAAAGALAAVIFMFPEPASSQAQTIPVLVLVPVLAFLMVSTLKYYSFKDLDLRRRQPYLNILFLALLFVAIGTHPQVVLLSMATTYTLSGPALKLYSFIRRSRLVAKTSEEPLPSAGPREPGA
jgi:CDP-diacylglycerol--serine O-phosphatidyltransferase